MSTAYVSNARVPTTPHYLKTIRKASLLGYPVHTAWEDFVLHEDHIGDVFIIPVRDLGEAVYRTVGTGHGSFRFRAVDKDRFVGLEDRQGVIQRKAMWVATPELANRPFERVWKFALAELLILIRNQSIEAYRL
jgi:hypothetical protein